ncbi:unnamed protein product [Alternaria sp. RS040]
MEDQNAYEYSPIDAKAQIRVLRLEPGTFAEPLIGSLLVRKIEDNEDDWPEYDGVSYCWGPQDNLTSFTCDGKALRITAVVDDMLRHLRESNEQRHLWIDAPLDLQSILTRGGQTRISDLDFEEEMFLWIAAEHVLGLQSYDRDVYHAGINVPKDINVPELLSEISGLLEGYDAFTCEHDRSFEFGIAFGQVEPGDFVFRTPGAVRGQDARSSNILPSAFGLIIRPYKSESDAGPTTFRLVGMCIDWHPDVKDPEFVEVVLV